MEKSFKPNQSLTGTLIDPPLDDQDLPCGPCQTNKYDCRYSFFEGHRFESQSPMFYVFF